MRPAVGAAGAAGVATAARRPEAARALIDYLASLEVSATVARTGLEPVVCDRVKPAAGARPVAAAVAAGC